MSVAAISYGQLTADDVNILFDGSTVGASAEDWTVDNDGTNHMCSLEINDGIVEFNLNTNHAGWYANMGEFYPGGNLDCSTKSKLMIRVQLPENPKNFKIEPLGIVAEVIDGEPASYGWALEVGDTARLNSGDATSSNPEFAAASLAANGEWQIIEYEVGEWFSTFPAKNTRMDPAKIIGVRVYYGWDAGDVALQADINVDWAVFVAPATLAADVTAFMSGGNSSVNDASLSGFSVYPNPVADVLRVDAENGSVINLLDMSGRTLETAVVKGANVEFVVSKYNKGVYFVQFVNGNQSLVEKVVFE